MCVCVCFFFFLPPFMCLITLSCSKLCLPACQHCQNDKQHVFTAEHFHTTILKMQPSGTMVNVTLGPHVTLEHVQCLFRGAILALSSLLFL